MVAFSQPLGFAVIFKLEDCRRNHAMDYVWVDLFFVVDLAVKSYVDYHGEEKEVLIEG